MEPSPYSGDELEEEVVAMGADCSVNSNKILDKFTVPFNAKGKLEHSGIMAAVDVDELEGNTHARNRRSFCLGHPLDASPAPAKPSP
jgi:hypothetical protein